MKKINKILTAVALSLVIASGAAAQGSATIRARFLNMSRDTVYFDFMEKSDANTKFPYKEGRVIEFDVELEDITLMKINTFISVIVQPGDEIDIEAEYAGRNYRDARFKSGSPESIAASEALNRIRAERLKRKYKTNIPAAMAIQTSPEEFFKTSVDEWKYELAILDEYRERLSPKAYNFVRSELDAIFIPNIISYPGNNLQEGYWTALDCYKLRDDDASLRNYSYMGMLNSYMRYMQVKKAQEKGIEYVVPASIREEYAQIAGFFDGKLRDAALLVFIYSSMASGRDFEAAEQLYKDYIARYNINPHYKKILNDVMK